MAKKTTGKKRPRPYSYEFTAKKGSTPKRYLLSGIPPTMWARFEARAKREHIAKRQVLLQAIVAWTDRPEEKAG